MNFNLVGEVGDRAKEALSPESYQRLLALKAKYDSVNLFRFTYPLDTLETEKA